MNIFVLDTDPRIAAQYHYDKHVIKQILETIQLLDRARGVGKGWENVKVALWVRESMENYQWTCQLGLGLLDEYTFRYEKVHKSTPRLQTCIDNPPDLPSIGLTPFCRNVKEDCVVDDPVLSYRLYYVRHKVHLASWKKRNVPLWFVKLNVIERKRRRREQETNNCLI